MNPAPNSILILCEGNHCRSPLAEALLRQGLGEGFRVESAGLAALDGIPAHPEAVRLLAERGLDITQHLSRQVTPEMALAADLILVMDQAQKEGCEILAPSTRGRVFLMGHWHQPSPQEIADPFLRGPEAFLSALEAIHQGVADWVPRLISKQRSA